MTVLMIIGSLVAGYWTGRAGPRWPITIGCAAFAAGLLIASPLITQHPNYLALSPGPRAGRHRHRHHGRPGHRRRPRRRAAGAVGHGRLGRQHQPGDRRGGRRLDPRRPGLLPASTRPSAATWTRCTSRRARRPRSSAFKPLIIRSSRPARSTPTSASTPAKAGSIATRWRRRLRRLRRRPARGLLPVGRAWSSSPACSPRSPSATSPPAQDTAEEPGSRSKDWESCGRCGPHV